MERERISKSLDGIKRIYPGSYSSFEDNATEALNVIKTGTEGSPRFANAEEILSSSDHECRDFSTILNLLARTEIMPAWSESAPYRVNTDDYSFEDLRKAHEIVTGEQYEGPPTGNLEMDVEEVTDPVDEAIRAEIQYENL